MKANLLLRILCVCACTLLSLLETKAQDGRPALGLERIKKGFMQQQHEQRLINAWTQNNELVWVPQWDALFSAQVESKEVQLVPLLPQLQSKDTHKVSRFKLLGARRYLVVPSGFENDTTYQFLTLTYDEKNQVQKDGLEFLMTFSGQLLRQAISSEYVSVRTYRNGRRWIKESKQSSSNSITTPPLSSVTTCKEIYTCYWSAHCTHDGITYGTITVNEGGCSNPFASAGACFAMHWSLTQQDVYLDCRYENPDYDPGFGPIPLSMRPCPGDPLAAMEIAGSGPGTPGNIRGGTFGPDVRRNPDLTPKKHEGVDLIAPPGTPIYAATSGVVIRIQSSYAPGTFGDRGYGNYVYIRNIDGTSSKYNHLDGVITGLTEGSVVNAGARNGTAGSTGNAAYKSVLRKHLHLQMFDSRGKPIDPLPYLRTPLDKKTGKGMRPC